MEWRSLFTTWRWTAILGAPVMVLWLAVAEWRGDGLAAEELGAFAVMALLLCVAIGPMLWVRGKSVGRTPRRLFLLAALAFGWAVGVYGLVVFVARAAGWIGPILGGPGSIFGPLPESPAR